MIKWKTQLQDGSFCVGFIQHDISMISRKEEINYFTHKSIMV